MLLSAFLDETTGSFTEAGIESALADAELLVAHSLGISRGEVQAKAIIGEEFSPTPELQEFIGRRIAREPLQHLTGEAYFRNLTLKVGKGVFVPRPETELLTQLAIDAAKIFEDPVVVDLCAGSGAIGIAIATELPKARVYAVEKSEDAYRYTKANYSALAPHATVVLGDAVTALDELLGRVDVLVSNPPYIPAEMVPIYPEVALHDPSLALYSGDDGLDLIRAISKRGLELVVPGGIIAIEHADMQSEAVVKLLEADGWRDVVDHKDFNGRPRAVVGVR
jgi:release factor glutamine methyltransferase